MQVLRDPPALSPVAWPFKEVALQWHWSTPSVLLHRGYFPCSRFSYCSQGPGIPVGKSSHGWGKEGMEYLSFFHVFFYQVLYSMEKWAHILPHLLFAADVSRSLCFHSSHSSPDLAPGGLWLLWPQPCVFPVWPSSQWLYIPGQFKFLSTSCMLLFDIWAQSNASC